MKATIEKLMKFLTDACNHYEKSAPIVRDYCDELYMRIEESPESVTLKELYTVERLKEEGIWEHPSYATNLIYRLKETLGMNTVGNFDH